MFERKQHILEAFVKLAKGQFALGHGLDQCPHISIIFFYSGVITRYYTTVKKKKNVWMVMQLDT